MYSSKERKITIKEDRIFLPKIKISTLKENRIPNTEPSHHMRLALETQQKTLRNISKNPKKRNQLMAKIKEILDIIQFTLPL